MYRHDTSALGDARAVRFAADRARRRLDGVRTQQQVVDYALRRRAVLRDLRAGRVDPSEVCDASPYLLRAAQYHGQRTEAPCPVCRREDLWHVNYVYGDQLGASAGQARTRAELPRMAMDYGEFRVYVVEVCRQCSWNHLVQVYTLGRDGLDGAAPAPSRRRSRD